MRFFAVNQGDSPVAVVFHDHREGVLYCRSRSASFLAAFDAVCARSGVDLVREGDQGRVLRAIHAGVEDYAWAENALDQLSTGFWSVAENGRVADVASGIDSIIRKYLT